MLRRTILAALIVGTLNPIFQVALSQAGFDSAASLGKVIVLLVVIGHLPTPIVSRSETS